MADTATYDLIASQTLASAASSITFSSIAASWTDLRLVVSYTMSASGSWVNCRFNSDSATNYSATLLIANGNGGGQASAAVTSLTYLRLGDWYNGIGNSTTIPEMIQLDIFSYAGSTYKTCLENFSGDNNGSGNTAVQVGLWRNTAALTSITLTSQNGSETFKIGTTAQLYGIKAA